MTPTSPPEPLEGASYKTLPAPPPLPSLPSEDELEAFLALADACADRDTARRNALGLKPAPATLTKTVKPGKKR